MYARESNLQQPKTHFLLYDVIIILPIPLTARPRIRTIKEIKEDFFFVFLSSFKIRCIIIQLSFKNLIRIVHGKTLYLIIYMTLIYIYAEIVC